MEEHKLRVFENSALRRIFGTGKKLSLKWTGHVSCMGEMRMAYNILDAKPEGKRPLGRP
jgi:hypothetical protein